MAFSLRDVTLSLSLSLLDVMMMSMYIAPTWKQEMALGHNIVVQVLIRHPFNADVHSDELRLRFAVHTG